MRRWGPALAAAVVIAANVLALAGVARNRAGEPESEVRLTERELPLAPWTDESTGVFLRLEWQRTFPRSKIDLPWFDRAKLESLGFDCSHPVDAKDAREHYGRMVARRAFVVLEYDGPAWDRWLDARAWASRLVPIDVGLDPGALRRLHPDRTRCLIVPAIVEPRWTEGGPGGRAVLSGRIQRHLLVSEIHVPRDLGAHLAALRKADAAAPKPLRGEAGPGPAAPAPRLAPPRYEVLLRQGTRLEPWVVEVRPLP